jgi:hypothetical protein
MAVVLLRGARKAGRTMPARELSESEPHQRRYVTLDDTAVLTPARSSPIALQVGSGDPATVGVLSLASPQQPIRPSVSLCPAHAVLTNSLPSDVARSEMERPKGLEPSTFSLGS